MTELINLAKSILRDLEDSKSLEDIQEKVLLLNDKITQEIEERAEKKTEDATVYTIYFDGASKGNGGKSSCAISVVNEDNVEIYSNGKFLGNMTNNEAEYQGLILGLKWLNENGHDFAVIKGDSQLVIKQMTGEYKCRAENLKPYYNECIKLLKGKNITFCHIERSKNTRADELANKAIP